MRGLLGYFVALMPTELLCSEFAQQKKASRWADSDKDKSPCKKPFSPMLR